MKKLIILLALIFCVFQAFGQKTEADRELIPYRQGDTWGYCNRGKQIVIAPKYDLALLFGEGLAAVRLGDKWGFVDASGNPVTPLKYDSGGYFSNGISRIKINGRFGYIDKNGTEYFED
ncbi:MAG: WG repeat-containing protein [Spirochaetales bacterium]|nr:WG repeat-containing protein [Spirochaetales bacterium]